MDSGDLAHRLGALAVEMQREVGAEATLSSVVSGAVALVSGARWAGISFIEGRQVVPRVPSDPIVEKLDRLQSDLDDGPCLDALREHRTVHIEDMATDQRWPRFSRTALEHGVQSLLYFQLFVTGNNIGALNLYATEPGVFDEETFNVGRIVAQHASVALAAVASEAEFQLALGSRDVIGQAKGILMERFAITGLQAFSLLTRLSQEQDIKLAEVSRRLVNLSEANAAERQPE